MARDPAIVAHQQWLGYVQPTGLVVSIPALLEANARLNQNIAPDQRRFQESLPVDRDGEVIPKIHDFVEFAKGVLSWSSTDLCGTAIDPFPASLEANLENYNETLRPTYALRDFQPSDPSRPWILLVDVLASGE